MKRENDALRAQVASLQSELDNFMNSIVNLIGTAGNFEDLVNSVGTLTDGSNPTSSTTVQPAGDRIGRWTEETYPVAQLRSGAGVPGAHVHDVYCDWNCFADLMAGDSVEVTSEDWDGHTHVFTFSLDMSTRRGLIFEDCDSCSVDTHSSIVLADDNTDVFLLFR